MNAWTPRLAMGLAALASFVLLCTRSGAQEDTRRKQQIQLDEFAPKLVTDAPFELTAKSTSGLAVSFEVIDGPAVMDGKKLKLTGQPGIVVVRATQKGDLTFAPAAPAERVITVRPKPFAPMVDFPPTSASGGIGDRVTLMAVIKGEPLPSYEWRHDGVSVSSASGSTLVLSSLSAQDAGSYVLVATNALGTVTTSPVRVSVGKHTQSINFPSQPSALPGQTIALNATASSGLPVEYRVISGLAVLTSSTLTLQQGSAIVEADQRGDSNYEAAAPVMQTFNMMPGSSGLRVP